MLFGDVEGDDFGVIDEVIFVPAFACDLAGAVEDDAAYGGVGRGDGDASAGELESAVHPVAILVGAGHWLLSFCIALPAVRAHGSLFIRGL
jgi:hypothetical protein